MRRWFYQLTVASMVCLSMASAALAKSAKQHSSSSTKPHQLLIHVDQNDPAVMNLALNNATNVIEYYRADLDHYFMSASVNESYYIDTVLASVYKRTGEVFYAWTDPALAPPGTPLQPVCRFSSPLPLINSFIFTAIASECQFMIANYPGIWNLDSLSAFYVLLSDGNGACPGGTLPIYRFFNNRNDANMLRQLKERKCIRHGAGRRSAEIPGDHHGSELKLR